MTARAAAAPQATTRTPVDESRERWALLAILAAAALVRLVALDSAPPGINQDEALSAWNGWCLLRTGHALSGETWPIFHCRNIGDYPTMLFFYVLMPFQRLFGLSVWSTRLPVALAGIVATVCGWDIGRRLAGGTAGLFAALVLAIVPWGVFLGHFGTGASLGPLQALLPLSFLARSGLAGALGPGARRAGTWALLAGLAFGLGTYGFHSLRIQLPLTLLAIAACSPGDVISALRDPQRRTPLALLIVGFLALFLPMFVVTLRDPESLHRWEMTRLWPAGASAAAIARLVSERWAMHFAPDFLFLRGDRYAMLNPARWGALAWWMLPGLLAGVLVAIVRVPRDARARLLLALLLLYPVGDLVSRNDGVHSLRSAAGLPALALAIGFGMAAIAEWLRSRSRALLRAGFALVGLVAALEAGAFGRRFFHDAVRDRQTQVDYQVALLDAGKLLHPAATDEIFCTTTAMNQPFVILLLGLRSDPWNWLRAPRDVFQFNGFDQVRGTGRLHFLYDEKALASLRALANDGRPDHVWLISRPGELGIAQPSLRIRAPSGEEMLWITERTL
jgi:4-amino-4-deoxy-L-arabinose transferase-like glycosyltransferase